MTSRPSVASELGAAIEDGESAMNLCYPASVKNYGPRTVGLFFPDVPEAATVAKTVSAAIDQAPDALVVALSAYVDDGRPIPAPSRAKRGQSVIFLPPMAALGER
ncbi:MAG: type II toxin-antitoxin system HicB family antitoxin [Sulfurisoma sp.]|nr:type II toxin-antitoxin system HicB family antitoxin [Sulfurisoma sp.]